MRNQCARLQLQTGGDAHIFASGISAKAVLARRAGRRTCASPKTPRQAEEGDTGRSLGDFGYMRSRRLLLLLLLLLVLAMSLLHTGFVRRAEVMATSATCASPIPGRLETRTFCRPAFGPNLVWPDARIGKCARLPHPPPERRKEMQAEVMATSATRARHPSYSSSYSYSYSLMSLLHTGFVRRAEVWATSATCASPIPGRLETRTFCRPAFGPSLVWPDARIGKCARLRHPPAGRRKETRTRPSPSLRWRRVAR